MRRIEVPTDTSTEFELGDTAADTEVEGTETTEWGYGEGGSQEGGNSTVTDRGGSDKKARIERSESEMDTEVEREACTSQANSRYKK